VDVDYAATDDLGIAEQQVARRFSHAASIPDAGAGSAPGSGRVSLDEPHRADNLSVQIQADLVSLLGAWSGSPSLKLQ
jgi:hypothetical protein